MSKAGGLQLHPADLRKIARSNAEQFSLLAKQSNQLDYRRTDLRPDLGSIQLHLLAHVFEHRSSMPIKVGVGKAFSTKHRAQDSDIRITVQRDAINLAVEIEAMPQRAVEGVVVRPAIGVEQSAVDIK